MTTSTVFFFFAALAVAAVAATAAFASPTNPFPDTAMGYVKQPKSSCSMFYYLEGDKSKTSAQRAALPNIIWLQGGPGGSSMFGAMLETGREKLIRNDSSPTNYSVVERAHAWTKYANMLYIDNPVGTGWSYCTNASDLVTTHKQIGDGLATTVLGFLAQHPEFTNKDFYLFSESFGGSMVLDEATALLKANVPINIHGIECGDGWVAPIQCMKSYGPFAQANSLANFNQSQQFTQLADAAEKALASGNGKLATKLWGAQQDMYSMASGGVNVYNIRNYYDYTAEFALQPFMENVFRKRPEAAAVIPDDVHFGAQGGAVFEAMGNAFMESNVQKVDDLLNAGIPIYVLSGQLDYIVDTLCIQGWMKTLTWRGMAEFNGAERKPVSLDPSATDFKIDLYIQQSKNLAFIQVVDAGHMLPLDQPAASEYFMRYIISDGKDPGLAAPLDAKKLASKLKRRRVF